MQINCEGIIATNFEDNIQHTVLLEYATESSNIQCSNVTNYLKELYSLNEYDFFYVTLVQDKNNKADERCSELGVIETPEVHFDGGYRIVLNDPGSIEPYMTAINESINRDNYHILHNVTLDITLDSLGNNKFFINVSVINNECCEGFEYICHLRVFVTEIESRWNDVTGQPYNFAMLDYVFNEDLTVLHTIPQNFTTIWNGNDFGYYDLDPENIMVIAAVYRNEDFSNNRCVDETAAATIYSELPDSYITYGPDGLINYTNVTFQWIGIDKYTIPEEILYSIKLVPLESEWSNWTNITTKTFINLTEGKYTFYVKSKNKYGEEDPSPAYRSFSINEGIKPIINIIKPEESLYLLNKKLSIPIPLIIGDIDIEIDAFDELGIQKIDFYINDELRYTDLNGSYSWYWSDLEFGKKTIKVEAFDSVGNFSSDEIIVWRFF
jgi:hypothetical protein